MTAAKKTFQGDVNEVIREKELKKKANQKTVIVWWKYFIKNHLARKETLSIELIEKQHAHTEVEIISVKHLSVSHMESVHSWYGTSMFWDQEDKNGWDHSPAICANFFQLFQNSELIVCHDTSLPLFAFAEQLI